MTPRLEGRRALLLGGAGAIGTAIAARFLEEGAAVVIADREPEARERAAAEHGAFAERVSVLNADALDADAADDVVAASGEVDIFVYLVGWIAIRRALEVPKDEFMRTIDVNLASQLVWAQAAARQMKERERGSIVLMGSILGYGGTPGRVAYNASRGGCIQLVRSLAVEWAPFDIRVNGLAPGWVDTPALRATGLDTRPLARRSPFGRIAEAADIAGPALFLASDDSRWVSGVMLPVDGAATAFVGAGDPTDWELQ